MRPLARLLTASLACLLITHWLLAQEVVPVPAPAQQTPAQEMIQLNFPENLEVKVLVDYVSKRLGINILYDQSVVREKVTIASPTSIPKDSLLGLLDSVLKMTGASLVDAEQPGWKKVVPAKDLLTVSDGFEQDRAKLASAPEARVLTQVFPLKNVTPQVIENAVRPYLSKPGGNSYTIPDSNLVLVTDYAVNLKRIATLVEMVDAPGSKVAVQFIPVKYLDAGELATRATSLLAEMDKVAARGGKARERKYSLLADAAANRLAFISLEGENADVLKLVQDLDAPTEDETRSYRFQYVSPERIDKLVRDVVGAERLKGRYRSTVDAASGLLIVSGPPWVQQRVETLRGELDTAAAATEESSVRFYKLTNTTATEVLATIQTLTAGKGGLSALVLPPAGSGAGAPETTGGEQPAAREPFTGPNVPPPGPGQELPKPPSYREPKADKEGATNPNTPAPVATRVAGAVTGTGADATVTADTNTNSIIVVGAPDVQHVYAQLIKMLDKRRPQVMIEVTLVTVDTSSNFSLGVELSREKEMGGGDSSLVFSAFGLSSVNLATGLQTLKPGVGFNGVIVSPDTVNAVIRALADSGRTKVLSAPKVLVNDNATATLASINEAPFTSVNASTTVATTSFAGYASAGTTITVTPHISEGDHLQLEYSVTLNSFRGDSGIGIPPPRQTNNINSKVTVPDGYAVIVGGLNRDDLTETISKIPFLGDIPLLEYVFSSRSTGKTRSTLFAFIRPVILRDDHFADLKYLSEKDLTRAQMDQPRRFPASSPMLMN